MLLLISRGQDTSFALGALELDAGAEPDVQLACVVSADVLSEPIQRGGAECTPAGLPDPTPTGGAPFSAADGNRRLRSIHTAAAES